VTRYVVDNSVLQRMSRSGDVREALLDVDDRGAVLCSSVVSVLEAGYSARSAASHYEIVTRLTESFVYLPLTAEVAQIAIELQTALWTDLLHAATAVAHDCVVLHYDVDFDSLSAADRRVRSQWIVPRGTVA
jgi:predicted nucleic acid-binding protein